MIIDWKLKTMWNPTSGVDFCGINKKTQKKFQFGNYVLCFPKGRKYTYRKIQ
jgi:hypothetical protein